MIEVRLFATFREGRDKKLFLDAEKFSTAGGILENIGIPPGDVSILLINGQHSKPHSPVRAGDVVALFPPVGGG